MRKAKCISILGTGSEVGKSVIATALCRLFYKSGIAVAPFKAQNMSNNSGVTLDGLEMGRAQIVQAEAAGIIPDVDMNPILLKPTSDAGSQVVVLGKALDNLSAQTYLKKKSDLFSIAADALDRLRSRHDLIVLEGAGSCAEVNLMPHDIVNFRMARHARASVIIVGDIHKGGIFAQIVGTIACLPKKYQDMVSGFIINRFRGDLKLFDEGVNWIEKKTRKKVFGVMPWYTHISIEPEDSVVIEKPQKTHINPIDTPAIGVIRIPHISNFNDVDPLAPVNGLNVFFLESLQRLDCFKGIIIPGSKNTRHDLNWLYASGWAETIKAYAEAGGHLLGICGGYQILGRAVHDPDGLEGPPGSTKGLSLLPVETVLKAPKTTTLTRFIWAGIHGMGYEIHMGHTQRSNGLPFCSVLERNGKSAKSHDGCISIDQKIIGTYIHGLFDTPGITRNWLGTLGLKSLVVPDIGGLEARNREYDRLAEHTETYLDIGSIQELIR